MFRFPSTNIRLEYQCLIEDKSLKDKKIDFTQKLDMSLNQEVSFKSSDVTSTNGRLNSHHLLTPLKVNIPDTTNPASNSDFISPIPSPTGTIRYILFYV